MDQTQQKAQMIEMKNRTGAQKHNPQDRPNTGPPKSKARFGEGGIAAGGEDNLAPATNLAS